MLISPCGFKVTSFLGTYFKQSFLPLVSHKEEEKGDKVDLLQNYLAFPLLSIVILLCVFDMILDKPRNNHKITGST